MKGSLVGIAVMAASIFLLASAIDSRAAERVISENVLVKCAGKSQVCSPAYLVQVKVDTPSLLKMHYSVPPSHCSSVRLRIRDNALITGKETITDFLGWPAGPGWSAGPADMPLSTGELNLGQVSSGAHTFEVQGEGKLGGCNREGYLASWGGTLRIVTTPVK